MSRAWGSSAGSSAALSVRMAMGKRGDTTRAHRPGMSIVSCREHAGHWSGAKRIEYERNALCTRLSSSLEPRSEISSC